MNRPLAATLLLAGLVASSLWWIYTLHESRSLFLQLEQLSKQRDEAMANALAQNRIALHRTYHDEVTGLATRSRLFSAGAERLPSDSRALAWTPSRR